MKQKTYFKSIIAVVLAILLLLPASAVTTRAADFTPSTARLFVNGTEVATSHGGNDPFNIEGTTYLPIRALSIALGTSINWRPETSNVYIGDTPATNTILVAGNAFTTNDVQATGAQADFTTYVGDDFSGWTLIDVLNHLGVEYSGANSVVVTAADGMVVALPASDALNPENGHLIFDEEPGTVRLITALATSRGTWVRDILEISFNAPTAHNSINLIVGGQAVSPTDANGNAVPPFMTEGVIYLPLRAVAEALSLDVGWNGDENAIYIGETPDSFDYSGEEAFTVTVNSVEHIFTMDNAESLGLVEFTAFDRRGGGEVQLNFTGVAIATVLSSLGIDIDSVENLTFFAADGREQPVSAEEALNPEYGFLAVAENGTPLGTWADDGRGPFMLVLAQDSFPQRWNRNIINVEVELASNGISIIGANGVVRTVTPEEVMGLGGRDVSATVRDTERNFTGVPLSEVFSLADVNSSGGDTVIVRALDGFSAILSLDEVLDVTNAHLVWLEDDEPVTTNENFPFMLVNAHDVVPARFVRDIVEIAVLLPAAEVESHEFGDYEFMITAGGTSHAISMDDLAAIGTVNFTAELRGEQTAFTGVPLAAILRHLEIDYTAFPTVISAAADGFTIEWPAADAYDEDRAFIVITENGEPLDDRYGPFRTVLVGAAANRWIRQLNVITLR